MQVKKPKQGYKFVKSPFGREMEIPEDWEISKGEKIFVLSSGISPSEIKFAEKGNGDTLYVQVDDMNLEVNPKEIIESQLKFNQIENPKAPIVDSNVIVFPKRGAAILTNKVRLLSKQSTLDTNIMALKCGNSLDVNFMYYYLLYLKLYHLMENAGIPQLNNKDLYPRFFAFPKILEQEKIALIISNVDSLIQQTQKIIQHTKRLKKGLMNKLINKGLGITKFTYHANQSLPANHELIKLNDVVNTNPNYKFEENLEYPFVEMAAIHEVTKNIDYFEQRKFESGYAAFKNGDTLFARITPSTENGKISLVKNLKGFGLGSTELIVLSPKENLLEEFLYYYCQTDVVRNYAVSQMEGTTGRQRVPSKVFTKDLYILLPTKKEDQQYVINIIREIEDQISIIRTTKISLEDLKKGLMQKLLTGQIRVRI